MISSQWICHYWFRWLLPLLASICFIPALTAQEQELKARVLRDAPRAWQEYLAFARRLQVTISKTPIGPVQEGDVLSRARWEIKQSQGGGYVQLVPDARNWKYPTLVTLPRGALDSGYSLQPGGVVIGTNPAYQFALTRPTPEAKWELDYAIWNAETRAAVREKILRQACGCLTLYNLWLPDLFQDPDFKISRAQVRQGGLVELGFDYPKPADRYPVRGGVLIGGGWMVLDPHQDWILREFEVFTPGTHKWIYHQRSQTRRGSAGHPLETRVVSHTTSERFDARHDMIRETREDPDLPDTEFMLTAFGLEEPRPWDGLPPPPPVRRHEEDMDTEPRDKLGDLVAVALVVLAGLVFAVLMRWLPFPLRRSKR